jgi:hypothetical protein
MSNILPWHICTLISATDSVFQLFYRSDKSCTVPFTEDRIFHYYFGKLCDYGIGNGEGDWGLGRYEKVLRQANGRQLWFEGRKMLCPNLYFWLVTFTHCDKSCTAYSLRIICSITTLVSCN